MDKPEAWLRRLVCPSLSDWLFAALMVWLFLAGSGWTGLLADGDTGWHIRIGESILDGGGIPRRDPFSFTRQGAPWHAWEWLAEVAFAALYRVWGLKGVVLLAGVAIAAYLTLLARHALSRGANVFAALAVCFVAAGASGIHFLARPHVFTLLLMAVSLWVLDRDRRSPQRAVWVLIPLSALWVNLHAGFFGFLLSLGLIAAGTALESGWRRASRYASLMAGCAAASLANPYGAGLHLHVFAYLRSDWIRQAVDEFQSPRFRSESALHFEILLFTGLLVCAALLRRRQFADAFLILAWAHAALVSVRHVPVFALVAAPIVAAEATRLWQAWATPQQPRSVPGILERLANDVSQGFRHTSIWGAVLVALLALVREPVRWPQDFPDVKFPVRLVDRQRARLASSRVFTSDQWGDYLIYRLHPTQKVFIDGRSDFYGEQLGRLYLRILQGHPEWAGALERYGCRLVLAPPDWPLTGLLRQSAAWHLVAEDSRAVLFERVR